MVGKKYRFYRSDDIASDFEKFGYNSAKTYEQNTSFGAALLDSAQRRTRGGVTLHQNQKKKTNKQKSI